MKIFIFLLAGMLFSDCSLLGQRDVTTISGQKIRVESDGSWFKLTKTDSLIIELDMISSTADPMQEPLSYELLQKNNINDAIRYLVDKAELNEIEKFLKLDDLEKDLVLANVEFSHAKQAKNKTEQKLIKTKIKNIKSKIKTAKKSYKSAGKTVLNTKELYTTKNKKLEKNMKALASELNVDLSPFISEFKKNNDQNKAVISPQTIKIDKNIEGNCALSRDEMLKNERIIETVPELFFTHTPDKLKSYFKDKDLIKVYTSIIKHGKKKFLRLQIKLISKDAARSYGHIQNGNMMRINFISGKSVTLNNSNDTYGTLEQYTGYMVFDALYPLNGDEVDLLGKVLIDQIGIMWSSGYELYDIYYVDVLAKHLSCLKSL